MKITLAWFFLLMTCLSADTRGVMMGFGGGFGAPITPCAINLNLDWSDATGCDLLFAGH